MPWPFASPSHSIAVTRRAVGTARYMLAGFDILNTAKDKKQRSGDRDGAAANSATTRAAQACNRWRQGEGRMLQTREHRRGIRDKLLKHTFLFKNY